MSRNYHNLAWTMWVAAVITVVCMDSEAPVTKITVSSNMTSGTNQTSTAKSSTTHLTSTSFSTHAETHNTDGNHVVEGPTGLSMGEAAAVAVGTIVGIALIAGAIFGGLKVTGRLGA